MQSCFTFDVRAPLVAALTMCFVVTSILWAPDAQASDSQVRVIVEYNPQGQDAVERLLKHAGATVHYRFDDLDAIVVTTTPETFKDLYNHPYVRNVEEDPRREIVAQTVPSGVDMVQARNVWDGDRNGQLDSGAPTGEGIMVCVIDSGLNVNHEDFQGVHIAGGYPSNWNQDGCGHGTHVAGTIAAQHNNVGVVGVSPGKASLYIVRVFGNNCGWSYASDVVNAANVCAGAGADVINMSLGGSRGTSTEQLAFKRLYDRGVLSVAAAGNSGSTQHFYPASYDTVISVAAVDRYGRHASFSQRNSQIELAAPGVGVLSTYGSSYARLSGTSMASPHVAGVAALIWSSNPDLSAVQVREAMQATATQYPNRTTTLGYGIVQAYDAWQDLGGTSEPPAEPDEPEIEPEPEQPEIEEPEPEPSLTISNVRSRRIDSYGSFEIRWNTNLPANSYVVFSCCGTFHQSTLRTDHRFRFRGSRNTIYRFWVVSRTPDGGEAVAGPFHHQN